VCSYNHCCSGKAISITYFDCVLVALGVQHAMRMLHIAIGGLSGSTLFYETNIIENETFFLFSLQILSEIFLILRRNERDIIHVTYLLFLPEVNGT
jgi:hypothetical protein